LYTIRHIQFRRTEPDQGLMESQLDKAALGARKKSLHWHSIQILTRTKKRELK
jgi:hypothetical protein